MCIRDSRITVPGYWFYRDDKFVFDYKLKAEDERDALLQRCLLYTSFKCPMRGDIRCGDVVKLPEGLYSGAASIVMANTTVPSVIAKNSTTFTGKFLVKSVRHIGSYLTADGDAWVTVFEAYAENWARV